RLEAVETVGAVQTICLDKTGTLTLNKMTAVSVYAGRRDIAVTHGAFMTDGASLDPLRCEELMRLMHVSVLCSETEIVQHHGAYVLHGSPTENALLHMAISAGLDAGQLRARHPLLRMQHRADHRNFMSTVHANYEDRDLLAIKGNPSEVLALCSWHMQDGQLEPLTTADRLAIDIANERMAGTA